MGLVGGTARSACSIRATAGPLGCGDEWLKYLNKLVFGQEASQE